MKYFLAGGALKLVSASRWTRRAYRSAAMLNGRPKKADIGEALWCFEGLPDRRQCLLDLGTGWTHALSVFSALLRQDELHAFDVDDLRNWRSFKPTVNRITEQILALPLDVTAKDRIQRQVRSLLEAPDFDHAYRILGLRYRCSSSGLLDYPDGMFDRIMSLDVLEHVDADLFPAAAREWRRVLRPGGDFVAQVGLDDHLAFFEGRYGSKRYLRYSRRVWNHLLGNSVQYINRLTASEIIAILRNAGFVIDAVETNTSGDTSLEEVHPDYRHQLEADVRAVRLMVRAHVPSASDCLEDTSTNRTESVIM